MATEVELGIPLFSHKTVRLTAYFQLFQADDTFHTVGFSSKIIFITAESFLPCILLMSKAVK